MSNRSLCFRLMEPVLLMMKSPSQQAGPWVRPLMAESFTSTTTQGWPLGWVLLAVCPLVICGVIFKDGVLFFFWTFWYNFRLVCLGGPKEDSKPACQCQTDGGHPNSGQEELLQWEPPSESRAFTSECIFYLSSYRKHVLYVCSADSYKKLNLSAFEPKARRIVDGLVICVI